MTDLVPGTRVGRWSIRSKLGQGGMGAVYEAEDPELGRSVALKFLLADDPELVRRFEREARAGSTVRHPNVAATLGSSVERGRLVIAVELIPGGTLRALLKREGALPWRRAAMLGAGIARGLEAIHGAGFVHRDLKPENVMLDGEGFPKVTDFGLVRSAPGLRQSVALTKSGEVLGTVTYMSPEQADGGKTDFRSDLYSLGATLYHLLVGTAPFEGDAISVIRRVLIEAPVPPRRMRADVPRRLDALVLRLLAKAPQDRPESAGAVARELEALAIEERAGGNRTLVVSGLFAAALLVGLPLFFLAKGPTSASPPAPEPRLAPRVEKPVPPAEPDFEKLWLERYRNLATGAVLQVEAAYGHEEPGHADKVRAVAFATVGKETWLISGGGDGLVKAWDAASGRERMRFPREGRVGAIRSIAVGGRRLVAGTSGEDVVGWEIASGDLLFRKEKQGGEIEVAITPDGGTVLSTGFNGPIRRWSGERGDEISPPTDMHTTAPWFLRCSPDGTMAAVGYSPGHGSYPVGVLSVRDGSTISTLQTTYSMSEGVYTPGGMLVTVGDGGNLVARDARTLAERSRQLVQEGATNVYGLAALPSGKQVVTGARDGTWELWDLGASSRPIQRVRAHASEVLSVAVSPDGKLLATGGNDGTVRFFDLPGGAEHGTPRSSTHRGVIHAISVSRDGQRVVTAGEDGTVKVLNAARGTVLATLAGHEGAVVGAGFVDAGGEERVLSVGRFDGLKLWRLSDRSLLSSAPTGYGEASSLAVSPDGARAVVSNTYRSPAVLLELEDGLAPRRVGVNPAQPNAGNWNAAFSPGSSKLVLAGPSGGGQNVSVVDLATGKATQVLPGHASWVPAVAFAGEDSVVSVAHDRSIVRWNNQRQEVWRQKTGTGDEDPTALVASADLKLVVVALHDGVLHVLDSETGALLDRIDLGLVDDVPWCCALDAAQRALWVGTGRGVVLRLALRR